MCFFHFFTLPNILNFLHTYDQWDTCKVDIFILLLGVPVHASSDLVFSKCPPSLLNALSSVQNLHWLMIIGDYTNQYIGDYHNPLVESLSTNQYIKGGHVFFHFDHLNSMFSLINCSLG